MKYTITCGRCDRSIDLHAPIRGTINDVCPLSAMQVAESFAEPDDDEADATAAQDDEIERDRLAWERAEWHAIAEQIDKRRGL